MAKKQQDEYLDGLKKLATEIEKFRGTPVFEWFKLKLDEWIQNEYRVGWLLQETKPNEMKIAQSAYHALCRARRVFDLPAEEAKQIKEHAALQVKEEKEKHPIFSDAY